MCLDSLFNAVMERLKSITLTQGAVKRLNLSHLYKTTIDPGLDDTTCDSSSDSTTMTRARIETQQIR